MRIIVDRIPERGWFVWDADSGNYLHSWGWHPSMYSNGQWGYMDTKQQAINRVAAINQIANYKLNMVEVAVEGMVEIINIVEVEEPEVSIWEGIY